MLQSGNAVAKFYLKFYIVSVHAVNEIFQNYLLYHKKCHCLKISLDFLNQDFKIDCFID